MVLQDWASVFQLGAGLNLVLGAYTNFREAREDRLEAMLDESLVALNKYEKFSTQANASVDASKEEPKIRNNLHNVPFQEMELIELRTYRSEIATRFWADTLRRRALDIKCSWALGLTGVVSLALLFFAAAVPTYQLSLELGVGFGLATILPPLAMMTRIAIESSDLNNQMRRKSSDISRTSGKEKKKHRKQIFHSKKTAGQAYAVANHIRNKLRSLGHD
jgi:hypothetical protein